MSPFIVEATPKIISWYKGITISSSGYFFSSSLDLLDLTLHFSSLAEAQTPYGGKVLFKMAQPEGAWVLFEDDSPQLWQGINKVWIPLHHGWKEKVQPQQRFPVAETLTFSETQWQAFSQIAWSHTLETISQHMAKWFPARLSAADTPRNWVAEWQMSHIKKDLQQSVICCCFSMLLVIWGSKLSSAPFTLISIVLSSSLHY